MDSSRRPKRGTDLAHVGTSSANNERPPSRPCLVALLYGLVLLPWGVMMAGMLLALFKEPSGLSTTLGLVGFGLVLGRPIVSRAVARRDRVKVAR
jgi:hypothetical protein